MRIARVASTSHFIPSTGIPWLAVRQAQYGSGAPEGVIMFSGLTHSANSASVK